MTIAESTIHPPILPREAASESSKICTHLQPNDLLISRPAFIIILTFCLALTTGSTISLLLLLLRAKTRRRRAQAAKAWGRRSRFDARISIMRKQIDDDFSRLYSGCYVHPQPENPFLTGSEPVELMLEDRCWELDCAPTRPAAAAATAKEQRGNRRSKAISLFFDHGIGVWMPKK